MKKKIVYFDMDGVLADFKGGLNKFDPEIRNEYTGRVDEIPGLFQVLEPIPGAQEAIKKLNKIYDIYVLTTAPWNNLTGASDKIEWIKQYFPEFYKKVIITHHKELVKGDYLVEDNFNKNGSRQFDGTKIWLNLSGNPFELPENIKATEVNSWDELYEILKIQYVMDKTHYLEHKVGPVTLELTEKIFTEHEIYGFPPGTLYDSSIKTRVYFKNNKEVPLGIPITITDYEYNDFCPYDDDCFVVLVVNKYKEE